MFETSSLGIPPPREICECGCCEQILDFVQRFKTLLDRFELAVGSSPAAANHPANAGLSDDRQFFTTKEAADLLHRKPFTIRFHCNLGRIKAVRASGRGVYGEWRISAAEIKRVMDEGLLPSPYKRPRSPRPRRSA